MKRFKEQLGAATLAKRTRKRRKDNWKDRKTAYVSYLAYVLVLFSLERESHFLTACGSSQSVMCFCLLPGTHIKLRISCPCIF